MTTTSSEQSEPGRGAASWFTGLFALHSERGDLRADRRHRGAFKPGRRGPLAAHAFDDQIRIWTIAFWWGVFLVVAAVVGACSPLS